jgi:CheY-like chemotaxis protein
VGLEAHQLSRVFDMFEQVETSLQRSEAGLGIGLTLVRELTQMHGGCVHARSEGLGRGSEFVVELPLPQNSAKLPAKQNARAADRAKGYKILVVDDNQDSVKSMSKLLELSGYSVTAAHSGQAALDEAAAVEPRVVLLDIGLPDLNGYEVARELRRRHGDRPKSLVALTGWGQPADLLRADEAGFDLHLLKPVDYAKLLKVLAEIE